ncbi:LysR family transcriptional regulator [Rhodobacteraceae bacterium KMM 6894]|nr:LysR family transcriptional regulator [Rhodobacteraceae bacterium KMM 6894]
MIDKLEMFIALAKAKHFGKAAEELGITQPTLSTGIKKLEDQLGVKLVFRGSKFGGLTPEGHSALEWARRIVSDARQLREEMRFTRNGLSGQLRVAVIPTALTWAAQISAQFTEKNPNVRLTLLSRTSIEILSMIENLDVDAGITYLDNEPTGRLSTEPLYRERYMLVCNKASQFYCRDTVGWKELEGERLALLTPENQNRRIINGHFRDAGATPDAWIESDSAVVLVANVERGDWLTILPADIARFLSQGKTLRLVPLSGNVRHPTVGLVAPFREPHTPTLQALLKHAANLAEKRD